MHDDRPATPDELQAHVTMVRDAIADRCMWCVVGARVHAGRVRVTGRARRVMRAAGRGDGFRTRRTCATRTIGCSTRSTNRSTSRVRRSCPLQISHLKTQGPRNWGKLDEVFRRIDDARRGGMDIMFDRYPYIAYQTGLTNLFPVWSRDGGTAAFFRRLDDPVDVRPHQARDAREDRAHRRLGQRSHLGRGPRRRHDRRRQATRRIRAGQGRPTRTTRRWRCCAPQRQRRYGRLRHERGQSRAHPRASARHGLQRWRRVRDDGASRRGSPHPRGLGTFPRVLGRYVRERKALTLEQAVRKMSALPASRIRLGDRGRIAPKLAADLVVFDPATVTDKATFEDPFQYPGRHSRGHREWADRVPRWTANEGGGGKALRPS